MYIRKTRPTEGFSPSFYNENFQTYSKVDGILQEIPKYQLHGFLILRVLLLSIHVTFMLHFKVSCRHQYTSPDTLT